MTFEHLKDPKKVFYVLDSCKMKFNQAKCVFVIRWGKFLSFLVSSKGIEPDPEEIYKISDVTPQKIKDV
jgi:hypothetical protein